jgi:serine/threonine-protein kinase RsbW
MLKYTSNKTAPSTNHIIRDFDSLFQEFKTKSEIEDAKYYNIMVAVTEGINNAAGHGNKFDPNKHVIVELEFDNEKLICKITDFGVGFNPDKVEDPRMPENLLKDSGRGVFIMKSLSNKFTVQRKNNSNIVEMVFNF